MNRNPQPATATQEQLRRLADEIQSDLLDVVNKHAAGGCKSWLLRHCLVELLGGLILKAPQDNPRYADEERTTLIHSLLALLTRHEC